MEQFDPEFTSRLASPPAVPGLELQIDSLLAEDPVSPPLAVSEGDVVAEIQDPMAEIQDPMARWWAIDTNTLLPPGRASDPVARMPIARQFFRSSVAWEEADAANQTRSAPSKSQPEHTYSEESHSNHAIADSSASAKHCESVASSAMDGPTTASQVGLSEQLHDCATNGADEHILRELLASAGHQINVVTSGVTPLARASKNGLVEVVTALLDHNADVEHDELPFSALFLACRAANESTGVEIASMLILHGANVNRFAASTIAAKGVIAGLHRFDNSVRATPLFIAAKTGQGQLVDVLLSNAADPNLANCSGCTPLMTAAACGHDPADEEILEALLKAGAEPNAVDAQGRMVSRN